MSATPSRELARATLWFDDQEDRVVVTIEWSDPARVSERIEFERLPSATEFLERHEFRPLPHNTSIWRLEKPPDNVVCIEEWRLDEETGGGFPNSLEERTMSEVSIPDQLPDWIKDHIERYLASDGVDGHLWDSTVAGGRGLVPTLLLTTTGRRSGKSRMLPLIYGERDGSYAVIASKGGHPSHPSWYLNLEHDPEVRIQVGAKKMKARARTAEGEERSEIWQQMRNLYPPYDDYQARTDREIPVVVLEPIDE